ncbi:hypothetical protein [Mycolicibacterium thermoresistibile]
MNKLWFVGIGGGCLLLLGPPVAAADPEVVGQPFGDAAAALRDAGRTVVVGVVVGNDLPLEECIVTNAREVSALRPAAIDEDYPQFYPDDGEIQLSVNCDAVSRSDGPPSGGAQTDDAQNDELPTDELPADGQ